MDSVVSQRGGVVASRRNLAKPTPLVVLRAQGHDHKGERRMLAVPTRIQTSAEGLIASIVKWYCL